MSYPVRRVMCSSGTIIPTSKRESCVCKEMLKVYISPCQAGAEGPETGERTEGESLTISRPTPCTMFALGPGRFPMAF